MSEDDKRGRLFIEIEGHGLGADYFGDVDSLSDAMVALGHYVWAEIDGGGDKPIALTITQANMTDAEVDALPEL